MAEFRSDIANDIADVLNTVKDKAKKYGGYAKIQALIKAEEAKKQELYYKLGRKYYELYKDAPASDLTEITDKILACDDRIAGYQEDLKNAENEGYTDVADTDCEDATVCDVDNDETSEEAE